MKEENKLANPLIIDCHMHLYPSKAKAAWARGDYEVWEYGVKDDVNSCKFAGDVDDGLAALQEARAEKGVVVNLFGIDMARDEAVSELPGEMSPEERAREIEAIDASIGERLRPPTNGRRRCMMIIQVCSVSSPPIPGHCPQVRCAIT